jgi:hypothetical protein
MLPSIHLSTILRREHVNLKLLCLGYEDIGHHKNWIAKLDSIGCYLSPTMSHSRDHGSAGVVRTEELL